VITSGRSAELRESNFPVRKYNETERARVCMDVCMFTARTLFALLGPLSNEDPKLVQYLDTTGSLHNCNLDATAFDCGHSPNARGWTRNDRGMAPFRYPIYGRR